MISSRFHRLFQESFLLVSYGSMALFLCYSDIWLGISTTFLFGSFLFLWLFLVLFFSSFAIVRHADALAEDLGEPYGTLILTLAATGIEIIMIAALMFKGTHPTLARNTMFSVIMILLGGILGCCLLIGGFRFREQNFNLKGEKAFMGLILPLSLFALVMPNFTAGTVGAFSSLHAIFLVALSLILYGIFLMVQTYWHREFFMETSLLKYAKKHPECSLIFNAPKEKNISLILSRTVLLLFYIPPIMFLSKKIALLLNLKQQGADSCLSEATRSALNGFIVAVLILAPEGLAALQAAWNNQMQRSVNLLLGSVLATIGLTVPAALGLGLLTGQPIQLGLDPAAITLLAVTLGSCLITFSQGQTNILQGAIHIFLFISYILLMFQ